MSSKLTCIILSQLLCLAYFTFGQNPDVYDALSLKHQLKNQVDLPLVSNNIRKFRGRNYEGNDFKVLSLLFQRGARGKADNSRGNSGKKQREMKHSNMDSNSTNNDAQIRNQINLRNYSAYSKKNSTSNNNSSRKKRGINLNSIAEANFDTNEIMIGLEVFDRNSVAHQIKNSFDILKKDINELYKKIDSYIFSPRAEEEKYNTDRDRNQRQRRAAQEMDQEEMDMGSSNNGTDNRRGNNKGRRKKGGNRRKNNNRNSNREESEMDNGGNRGGKRNGGRGNTSMGNSNRENSESSAGSRRGGNGRNGNNSGSNNEGESGMGVENNPRNLNETAMIGEVMGNRWKKDIRESYMPDNGMGSKMSVVGGVNSMNERQKRDLDYKGNVNAEVNAQVNGGGSSGSTIRGDGMINGSTNEGKYGGGADNNTSGGGVNNGMNGNGSNIGKNGVGMNNDMNSGGTSNGMNGGDMNSTMNGRGTTSGANRGGMNNGMNSDGNNGMSSGGNNGMSGEGMKTRMKGGGNNGTNGGGNNGMTGGGNNGMNGKGMNNRMNGEGNDRMNSGGNNGGQRGKGEINGNSHIGGNLSEDILGGIVGQRLPNLASGLLEGLIADKTAALASTKNGKDHHGTFNFNIGGANNTPAGMSINFSH